MTLQERLQAELFQATREGDKLRQSVIRLVRAGVQNAEKQAGKPLDEAGVLDILSREVKRRRESIAEFSKGQRQDLVDKEEAELAILLEYLPKQMSRDEIAAAARQVIAEVGAKGPADKGRVMGKLMPQLKGKAQGQEVSSIVTELLDGS